MKFFPDKALLANQYVEWPLGGRKITPRHAVEILQSVGPVLAGAMRVHPRTDCVPDLDVTSNIFRRSGADPSRGAGAGHHACFNRKYHNQKYFRKCWSPLGFHDGSDKTNLGSDANTNIGGITSVVFDVVGTYLVMLCLL